MAFAHRLDETAVGRASSLVLDAEPILGCRLVDDAATPYWEPSASRDVFYRLSARNEYEAFSLRRLDATRGPQLEVGLFHDDPGDRLLFRMTHEAGDGASLQYLAVRLGRIYSALCRDAGHVPDANRAVDRDLTQVLAHVPVLQYPGILWNFFRFVLPRSWPRRDLELPLPARAEGPPALITRDVPPRRAAFLSAFGRARGATLNDMFLAAAYRALAELGDWDGSSGLRIAITVNLRRWGKTKDQPGPVCNLSAFECPFLGRRLGRDFAETLAQVQMAMAERKRSRPGYALAILLHRESTSRQSSRRAAVERGLTFSNEGALDRAGIQFESHVPVHACVIPPYFALPRLHMTLSGYAGALTLLAVTADNARPVVATFFDALLGALPRGEGGHAVS